MSSERAAYDALVEHFTFHPRGDAEGIAHNAIAVLRRLPVDQRMEAMGMVPVKYVSVCEHGHGDVDAYCDRGHWTSTGEPKTRAWRARLPVDDLLSRTLSAEQPTPDATRSGPETTPVVP